MKKNPVDDWILEPQKFDPKEAARVPVYKTRDDDEDEEFEAAFEVYLERRAEAVLHGIGRPRKSK